MPIRSAAVCIVGGALLAGHITTAMAQSESSHGSDAGVSIRVGTLGLGVELSKLLTSHIGIRVGGNYFSLTKNSLNQTDVTYDAKLKLQSFSGLLDLYPGARGSFHLTGGVISSPLKITGTGTPTGGNFTINGNSYSAAQVGVLTGEAKFASAEPYVGLGVGTAASKHGGVGFVFDLGAAIGKPTISLTSTGAASNPNLQRDLTAQIATSQKSADKLVAYPVIALGLMVKF
ncbi:MAG: hypothetical protein ACRELE_05555 [Gemmatimonadales bacterium]